MYLDIQVMPAAVVEARGKSRTRFQMLRSGKKCSMVGTLWPVRRAQSLTL
ncbi:hypothetical protein USA:Philadelphia,PA_000011 [unidentified adenovirus]|nr:hypothetical protein USA:Philadelphia,PA_000011 [unidentified adenovirus]